MFLAPACSTFQRSTDAWWVLILIGWEKVLIGRDMGTDGDIVLTDRKYLTFHCDTRYGILYQVIDRNSLLLPFEAAEWCLLVIILC